MDKDGPEQRPALGLFFVKRRERNSGAVVVPLQNHNRDINNTTATSPSPSPPVCSPRQRLSPQTSPSCICYRPSCVVVCTKCDQRFKGRVRMKCPRDQQTFLMDLNTCPDPACLAESRLLREIQSS